MSAAEAFRKEVASSTLAAATPISVVILTLGAATIGLVISNTGGTNPIDTVTIEKSPLGNLYGPDTALGTAVGSTTAGGQALVQISARGFASVRVTLTSTLGTSYALEAQGVY